jgi:hypothetical protein
MSLDLDAVKAALEKAHTELGEICKDPRNRFRMRIPAQPDYDSDLIISDALRHGDALLAEVSRLTDGIHTALDALRNDRRCKADEILTTLLDGGAQ